MSDNYAKIYARYSNPKNNYFKKDKFAIKKFNLVDNLENVRGKDIIELGAGGSSYCKLFLDYGCNSYHGIDIIKERLDLLPSDSRVFKYHGDFLEFKELVKGDIFFSSLTMMFLVPQHKILINKIYKTLKKGGYFIGFDPNYISPISLSRLYFDTKPNPAKFFSPFNYSKIFEERGFKIDSLLPVLKYRNMKILWPLATSFMIKATKL